MKTNEEILQLGLKIARNSINKRYNYVAIITNKKNKILSIGMNSYIKTHPLQAKYALKTGFDGKIYLHSEIDALIRCKLIPEKIFIVRTNRFGEVRYAKPCPICMEAIKKYKVKEIFYTVNNLNFGIEYV